MEKLLRAKIKELEQKTEQLYALYKVGKVISSSLDFEEVLATGLDSILKATKADDGSIMILDEETGNLAIKMSRGLSKKVVQNVSYKLGKGIAGRVAETGEPLLLVNGKVKSELKPLLKRKVTENSMSIPLKVKERVIGVLNVNKKSSTHTFNQEDLERISDIAGQLAMAIENATLYEVAQRNKKELDTKVFNLFVLFEASRALSPLLDIEEILKLAIDMFIELIRSEHGLIMTLEEETGELVVGAAKGLGKDFSDQAKLKIGEHAIQYMLQLKAPVLFTDADSKLKDYCPALYQKLTKLEMELCIPLATGDKLIGLVALGKKLTGAGFSASDLEFISTLAKQVVSSLENARLVNAKQKWGEELESKVKERTNELEKKTGELEHANIQLQELDRLKSMFIASMSHELRTPLNSIIGFTGILIMGIAGEVNEEQSKHLTMVKNSANHLLALINDIIDVSKIEADKVELLIEEFDLSPIVQGVKDSFTVAVDKKDLKMSLNMPEKLVIKSDERRVKQIIMNLASNAVKFTDEGEIEIKVSKKDEMVEISVRDTGFGMRKEDMDRLFNAFSRIPLEGRTVDGTGLGLYLSKKIANLLGGEILAESEFGKGSNFTFKLPLSYKDNHG